MIIKGLIDILRQYDSNKEVFFGDSTNTKGTYIYHGDICIEENTKDKGDNIVTITPAGVEVTSGYLHKDLT